MANHADKAAAVDKTDDQWHEQLTPEQYAICRCSATERAFTGKFWNHKAAGTYTSVACGAPLFSSQAKYDSGSGWPSYWQPMSAEAMSEHADEGHGMQRVEVKCAHCASGWPAAQWVALLHQFRGVGFHAGGRRIVGPPARRNYHRAV
jgi:peptide-methionine (R)-S-oxide reductase